ncbi:hypothetical protein CYY_000121 [Polysphondylium violaceum]|uniref:GPS domain-containing protein n=1 Tax=Polysphondylium violaceum TaxID=133409 RepID=A0A8J4Q2I3_9MYCE|nr:hypothetical protein CYY_000121 [Polysphondylium violaceum]
MKNNIIIQYLLVIVVLLSFPIFTIQLASENHLYNNYDLTILKDEYENILKNFYNKNQNEYENDLSDILNQLQGIQENTNTTNIFNDLEWYIEKSSNNNLLNSNSNNNELKVGMIVSSFEGLYSTSGIGTVYSVLSDFLVSKGYKVTVIYTRDEAPEKKSFNEWRKDFKSRGIELVHLPTLSTVRIDNPYFVRKSYQVYQFLKDQSFDILHFPDFEGMAYYTCMAKSNGLYFQNSSIVVGLHGPTSWVVKSNTQKLPIQHDQIELDYMERKSVEMADIIWTPSNYIVNWLVKNAGWNIPSEKLYLLPFLAHSSTKSLSTKPSSSSSSVNEFVFFGRMEQRKGLDLFLDSLDLLSKSDLSSYELSLLKVTFLGRSSEIKGENAIDYIRTRSKKWPFTLSFITDKSSQEALQYLVDSPNRLAVIPSLQDNAPYTLYECLYNQVPFIATSQPSMIPLIDSSDHSRVLFDAKAPQLLRKMTQSIKKGAYVAKPTFTKEKSESSWSKFYSSIVVQSISAKTEKTLVVTQQQQPLVSVCIVHFNRPLFLQQAIDSIKNQVYQNYEVIIVDDGSNSSESIKYLNYLEKEFSEQSNWKLIKTSNRYLGAARNTASKEAKGKYLYFLDDDNFAYPQALSTYVDIATYSKSNIVTAAHSIFEKTSTPTKADVIRQWVPLGPSLSVGLFKNCFGDANFFIEKKVFDLVGGFTEEYGVGLEDHELLAKLVLQGYKLSVSTEPLLYYRMHDPVDQMVFKTNTKYNQMRYIRPYSSALTSHKKVLNVLANNAVLAQSKLLLATCNITVSRIEPKIGSLNGGTPVSIYGSGFSCGISEVNFGGFPCTALHYTDSVITCNTPQAKDPGSVDVTIIPVDKDSKQTLFDSFAYSPPTAVKECVLGPDETFISCSIDREVQTNSPSCSKIFTQNSVKTFGQGASCSYSDPSTLVINLGDESSVLVNQQLQFIAGGILSTQGEPNDAQKVTLQAATGSIPIASIKAPNTVGPCDQVLLDGSHSSGGAGKPLVFLWTVTEAPANKSAIQAILKGIKGDKVEIPNNLLAVNQTYSFNLKVSNWLGKSDSNSVTISKVSSDVIKVTIDGPTKISMQPADLSLIGKASVSGCNQSKSYDNLVYSWNISPAIELGSSSKYVGKNLTIPENKWEYGTSYVITLTVSDGADQGYATVTVFISKAPIKAVISGGDKKFGPNSVVTLDASKSSDPTNANAVLLYKWACTTQGKGKDCGIPLDSTAIISFNASLLPLGKYLLAVSVDAQDDDSRTGTAVTHIEITNEGFIDVSIDKSSLPEFIDPSQKLILKSVIVGDYSLDKLSFLWNLDEGKLAVLSEDAYSTKLTSKDLAIRPNALKSDTLYTFSLSVMDNTKKQGRATISFKTEAKPSGGQLICKKKTGTVMDEFIFDLGEDWDSNSGISGYMFRYKSRDDGPEIPLGERSNSSAIRTFLPPGKLTIIGYAYSGNGIASQSQCQVEVATPGPEEYEQVLKMVSEMIANKDINIFSFANCVKVANSLVISAKGKLLTSAQVSQKVQEVKSSAINYLQAKVSDKSSAEAISSIIDMINSAAEPKTVVVPQDLSNSMKVMKVVSPMMSKAQILHGDFISSVEYLGNVNNQLFSQIKDMDPALNPLAESLASDILKVSSQLADGLLSRYVNGEEAVIISENGLTLTTFKEHPAIMNSNGTTIKGGLEEPQFILPANFLEKNLNSIGKSQEVKMKYLYVDSNIHFSKSIPKDSEMIGPNVFSLDLETSESTKLKIEKLDKPIEIQLGKQKYDGDLKCYYWDESKEEWSNDGVETSEKNDVITCKTTHLTQFSLFKFAKGGGKNNTWVIVGSVVGSVLAAGVLAAGVVIVKRKKNKKRNDKSKDKKKQDKKDKKDKKAAAAASKKDKKKGNKPSDKDPIDPVIPASKKKKESKFGDENDVEYILQEFKDIYQGVKKQEQLKALKRRSPISPVSTIGASSSNSTPVSSVETTPEQQKLFNDRKERAAKTIQRAWKNYYQQKQLEKEAEVEELLDNIGELLSDDEQDPFEVENSHYDENNQNNNDDDTDADQQQQQPNQDNSDDEN